MVLMKKAFILIGLLSVIILAKDLKAPVRIDPTIQSFDGLFSQKLSVKFFVGEILDKRANAPTDTLGMTRTGRNIFAPIVTKLLPSSLLKNSIAGMLREVSAYSEDRAKAKYVIEGEVLFCDFIETSKVFSQEIRAIVKFRIKIRNAATDELVKQFVIASENERTAFDTTPFAEKVMTNALISGMVNILQDISMYQ